MLAANAVAMNGMFPFAPMKMMNVRAAAKNMSRAYSFSLCLCLGWCRGVFLGRGGYIVFMGELKEKRKKKGGKLSPVWAVVFACNLPDVDMTGCCFYTVMLAVVSSPGMYIHSSFVTAVTVNV